MLIAIVVLVALILVLAVAVAVHLELDLLRRRRRWEAWAREAKRTATVVIPAEPAAWLERAHTRRLVVHTRDEQSIEGTVVLVAEDGLVLTAAKLLGSKTVNMAGEVWVPRGQVRFVQTVAP